MRRSSILTIAAVSCVLFGVAVMRLDLRFSSAQAAAQTAPPIPAVVAPTPQGEHLEAVKAPLPASLQASDIASPQVSSAPGTLAYSAKRGDTIPGIAHQYLKSTSYLTSSELAEAIRSANGNRSGNLLKAGEQISIPGILAAPIVEKTVPVSKDF